MLKIQLLAINRVPNDLRNKYLNSLPEPQEYFLEQLVQEGNAFLIEAEGPLPNGYLVLNGSTVVEMFFSLHGDEYIQATLTRAIDELGAKTALVKSFDSLNSFLSKSTFGEHKSVGFLFRKFSDELDTISHEIRIDNLNGSDIEEVILINNGFFNDKLEIEKYIASKSIFSYRNEAGTLVACGILSRVIEGRDAVDIGMLVSPNHRNRGLGTYVASHLKYLCLARGDRPIAGCDIENIASKKALVAAGFQTQHLLLEYSLQGID